MKKIFLYIAFICSLAAFAQNEKQESLLEKAYNKNSRKELKFFFENWNEEISSITDQEFNHLNDTLKNAYAAFTAFYKPTSVDQLGGSEWGSKIYQHAKYLIVQNNVKIYLTDKIFYNEEEKEAYAIEQINRILTTEESTKAYLRRKDGKLFPHTIERFGPDSCLREDKETFIDSIIDFKPIIKSGSKKPLYLTSEYETILNTFLGNEQLPLGTGSIMNAAKADGDSKLRQNFLENFIKIWAGHWGGYWQLISYPQAYSIVFDKKMEYARIYYRMVYEGGEAILKNNNGAWTLVSGKITWIE